MLVELHIRRGVSRKRGKPGSEITFPGGFKYLFGPNPDLTDGDKEAHVCEVEDEGHLARLLSIKEYTEYGEEMTEPEPKPEPELVVTPDEPSESDELQEEEDEDLELAMCETIVSMKVSDAKAELDGLSDESLAQLAVMERAGQARVSLLDAIDDEQAARQEEADEEE